MNSTVRITFLGGLGEIGRNCAAFELDGRHRPQPWTRFPGRYGLPDALDHVGRRREAAILHPDAIAHAERPREVVRRR